MLHMWSLKREMCVCLGGQPSSPSVYPHATAETLFLPWIIPSLAETAFVRENAVCSCKIITNCKSTNLVAVPGTGDEEQEVAGGCRANMCSIENRAV